MVSSIMSSEDKGRPSIASTYTAKIILFCLAKHFSMKHAEAPESINTLVASLLGPNQIGMIKQEVGLANGMRLDFVVLRFDFNCMVSIVTNVFVFFVCRCCSHMKSLLTLQWAVVCSVTRLTTIEA